MSFELAQAHVNSVRNLGLIPCHGKLQSLTKAALDEEEAQRTAAVHEVLAALSGNIEVEALQSLRSEVDTLVEGLRLEVVVEAAQDQEVEQVVQVWFDSALDCSTVLWPSTSRGT